MPAAESALELLPDPLRNQGIHFTAINHIRTQVQGFLGHIETQIVEPGRKSRQPEHPDRIFSKSSRNMPDFPVLQVTLPGVGGAEIQRGRLVRSWTEDGAAPLFAPATDADDAERAADDELRCISSWLDAHADRLVLDEVHGRWASRYPAVADFTPTKRGLSGR